MNSFELNKILGAILGTCLFVLALNITAGAMFSAPKPAKPVEQAPSEEALDSGVEESFPASDPVSVTVTKVKLPKAQQDKDKEKADEAAPAGDKRK